MPGLIESQRLAAAGDYEAAIAAYHPRVVLGGDVVLPILAIGITALGTLMALYPHWWSINALGINLKEEHGADLERRLRVYGFVIAGLGAAASIALGMVLWK